jgi:hypothetical protein
LEREAKRGPRAKRAVHFQETCVLLVKGGANGNAGLIRLDAERTPESQSCNVTIEMETVNSSGQRPFFTFRNGESCEPLGFLGRLSAQRSRDYDNVIAAASATVKHRESFVDVFQRDTSALE